MTGVDLEEQEPNEDDVIETEPWKAHDDAINCVTYIPDLDLIATCAFDCHVYMWNVANDQLSNIVAGNSKIDKVGSLLLGNKALPPGSVLDAEQRRYKNQWKVHVDKMTRYHEELQAAREMLDIVEQLDYN